MNVKKIIFGIFLVFSLYVGIKLSLLYLQPAPKIYETVDGQLYLYNNNEKLKLADAKILIANGLAKGFENITESVIQDACNDVGGTYYNNTCWIGKLHIIDGKGILKDNTDYSYLTNDQLMKLIQACSSGNCPIGYVGGATTVEDYVHYNVSDYKNNAKPRPVGSKVLLKIFSRSDTEIINILKRYVANELGANPNNIDIEIKNKLLVADYSIGNTLISNEDSYVVKYTVSESTSGSPQKLFVDDDWIFSSGNEIKDINYKGRKLYFLKAKPGSYVAKINITNFPIKSNGCDCSPYTYHKHGHYCCDDGCSGIFNLYVAGLDLKKITDIAKANNNYKCYDINNNFINCNSVELKSEKSNNVLKLSGWSGYTFNLSLKQNVYKYKIYKLTGSLRYILKVKYNGKVYYFNIDLSKNILKDNKILEFNTQPIFDYLEKINIKIFESNTNLNFYKTVGVIFNEN